MFYSIDHRYTDNDLEQDLKAQFFDKEYDPELVSDDDVFDLAEFVNDRLLDAYADAIHDFYDTECERWERDGDDE